MSRDDVQGKTVVITGGTSGIGAATARHLLAQGANVGIIDVNPATAEFAAGLSPSAALGVVGDVTSVDSLEAAFAQIVDAFGGIDVVIANAGLLIRAATLRTTPPSDVARLFDVNVVGVVNTVQCGIEHVIARQGQIVVISSVFSFLNGMGTLPYAMSKAAVEQLGRGLRVELAAHGVSVTTAYFALIETPMIRDGVDGDPAVDALLKASVPRPLLVRLQPEQAAAAIVSGIETRAARVMTPGRYKPLSALRGLTASASDNRLIRSAKTQRALTHLDNR